MTLGERQEIFALNYAKLILWANEQGYKTRLEDVKSKREFGVHAPFSLHYKKLAGDISLFKDGVYLTKTEDNRPLGEYWVTLHPENNWGGTFGDGNHFSMKDGVTNSK